MTRARLAALALAATLAAGCTTFSDNDLAARVDDAELTPSQLSQQMTAAGAGELTAGRYDAPQARLQITEWIRGEVAEDSGLLDLYASGDGALPISCFFVLPAADHAAAEALVARLDAGETWDEVAESQGPEAAASTRQPCLPLTGYIPEIADQLATLSADGTPIIIDATDPAGSFVVRAHTLEELDLVEFLDAVNQADPLLLEGFVAAFDDADIYIDPRFGRFDTTQFGVAALG